jgi:hypothetical protein
MKTNNRGTILFTVAFTIAIGSAVLGTLFLSTIQANRMQYRTSNGAAAVALADGVLEFVYHQWRYSFSTAESMPMTESEGFETIRANALGLAAPEGLRILDVRMFAADPLLEELAGEPSFEVGLEEVSSSGGTASEMIIVRYVAQVDVAYATVSGNRFVTVQRVFTHTRHSPFSGFLNAGYTVAWNPGQISVVAGKNNIQGKLYTAHNHLKLTDGKTQFTGEHLFHYEPDDQRFVAGEFGDIASIGPAWNRFADNWNPSNPPAFGPEKKLMDVQKSELDPAFILSPRELSNPNLANKDSDGNPNNNGYYEILKRRTDANRPDPFDNSKHVLRLPDSADYIVEIGGPNVLTVFQGDSTTPLVDNNPVVTLFKDAVSVSNKEFFDAREKANVTLHTVDVAKITKAVQDKVLRDNNNFYKQSDSEYKDGMSIHFVDRSASPSMRRAFRLVNGAKLPNGGMTISTPNPIYVQGDYNTGREAGKETPSNVINAYNSYDNAVNSGNWTNPPAPPATEVEGYKRRPAAIVADSLNILSNSWSDDRTGSSSSHATSNTTINAVLISGDRPTSLPPQSQFRQNSAPDQRYSGGVENFPRLHEGWGGDGKMLSIHGSIGIYFTSQQTAGYWKNANYGVPNRRWRYDKNLRMKTPAGFPPEMAYSKGLRMVLGGRDLPPDVAL